MSRGNWNRIKITKFFYVRTYRKLITFIFVSQVFNVILCVLISYFYLHKPTQTFYATSGIFQPIQLGPMDTPNFSAQALLDPDPVDEERNKVIPE